MTSEMCRLCLRKDNLKPIFTKTDSTEKYSFVLLLTTGLHIEINDGLPQTVCNVCAELVYSAQKLRDKSRQSEIDLLKMGFKRNLTKPPSERQENVEECSVIHHYDDHSADAPNFEILVELDRLTGMKEEDQKPTSFLNANDRSTSITETTTQSNLRLNIKTEKSLCESNIKRLSRKEKRAVYVSLVEGPLDPKGPIKCRICKKTVSKWASFMTHSKLHLGFKFMCEYCGKSFISSTQLNRHCRSHHGMRRHLPCPHCDYLALDNTQLVLHERRMHTGERPFVCDVCGTAYFSRRCLIQHIENHATVKSIQCERCPQAFKSRRHLARHTYTTHTSKQYQYKCPVCAHIYRNFKYIRVHLRKLHGLTTREAKIVKIKL